jgi:hypothetical protein
MKQWLSAFVLLIAACTANPQSVTLIGNLQGSNGLPSSNYSISFVPTQWFYIGGTGVVINTTSYCATSTDGSVVGIQNPLVASIVTPAFTGTLPAANYYVKYTWVTAVPTETLPSPESVANLSSTGELQIPPPPGPLPAGVLGMKVYVGLTSGSETLQGSTTGTAVYLQSIPLVSGAALPSTNNTVCKQIANDAGWPTGTGYTVSVVDSSGNTLPGYPMTWQLLGPNTTINLSNGLPYYHGVVTFPVPILATPQNHAAQSISGPLSMTGYNVVNVGRLGVGTGLPAWGVDVEGEGLNALINAKGGYLINGNGGTVNQVPCSDGTSIDLFCDVPVGTIFYQTIILGSHAGDAITQRQYLQVGPGTATGLTAFDVVGVGSQVGRSVLQLNAVGGGTTLLSDPFAVVTAGAMTPGQYACIDGTGGGISGSNQPCSVSGTYKSVILPNQVTCAPATSTDASCTYTQALGVTMADTGYTVSIQPQSTVGAYLNATVTGKTNTAVTYVLSCSFNCSSYGTLGADVTAIHP